MSSTKAASSTSGQPQSYGAKLTSCLALGYRVILADDDRRYRHPREEAKEGEKGLSLLRAHSVWRVGLTRT